MASISYIGHSSDYRTNRWRVTCDCGRVFEPQTTMQSYQTITCPKCKQQYQTDYNATPAIITKLSVA